MSSATLANGDEYTYGYNAMGFRTVKQLPGAGQSENAVIYMRDPQGRLMGEFDAQGSKRFEQCHAKKARPPCRRPQSTQNENLSTSPQSASLRQGAAST